MSDLYEIAELDNGDIVLQRAGEKGEPLVRIKFSDESLYFLSEAKYDVAKAMIEAGLDAATSLGAEIDGSDTDSSTSDEDPPVILH